MRPDSGLAATCLGWRLFTPLLNISNGLRGGASNQRQVRENKYANCDRLADPKKQSIIPLEIKTTPCAKEKYLQRVSWKIVTETPDELS
jgi:hypothetical protein